MRVVTEPRYATGRRFRSDLYAGKVGTVIKVRPPAGVGSSYSYDLAWDGGGGVEKVDESILVGPTWRALDETLNPEQTVAAQYAYLEEKLRRRAQAAQRRGVAPGQGGGSFYRPSQSYVRQVGAVVAHDAAAAAKAIRGELLDAFDGVTFQVKTKGDLVTVTWTDGPVYVGAVTDRHVYGRDRANADRHLPHAGQVMVKREISDSLIEAAIEYVREAIGEPMPGADAAAFRSGALRDAYPRQSHVHSGLSVGSLVRVVLLRWDDHQHHFVGEGMTRAMITENAALFPGQDLGAASQRMRLIRAEGLSSCESTSDRDLFQKEV